MKAFVYLVFPNSTLSVLPEESLKVRGEPMEHGLITSFTHGVMSGKIGIYVVTFLLSFIIIFRISSFYCCDCYSIKVVSVCAYMPGNKHSLLSTILLLCLIGASLPHSSLLFCLVLKLWVSVGACGSYSKFVNAERFVSSLLMQFVSRG